MPAGRRNRKDLLYPGCIAKIFKPKKGHSGFYFGEPFGQPGIFVPFKNLIFLNVIIVLLNSARFS